MGLFLLDKVLVGMVCYSVAKRQGKNQPAWKGLMKIKCSLLLASLVALLALICGCSTVSSNGTAISHFPKNTIVIRNRTPYTLKVLRNGTAWKSVKWHNGQAYHLPLRVMPRQEFVLYNTTSQTRERITLGLDAIKDFPPSCEYYEELVGKHRFRLDLGVNNPSILVTVRGPWFLAQ